VIYRILIEAFLFLGDKKESITNLIKENNLAARGYQIKEIAWLR
jgi:hypothetical protein